jgi:hypothetical protein
MSTAHQSAICATTSRAMFCSVVSWSSEASSSALASARKLARSSAAHRVVARVEQPQAPGLALGRHPDLEVRNRLAGLEHGPHPIDQLWPGLRQHLRDRSADVVLDR